MSKILVTGGAGFIGSHLVDELVKQRHKVIVFDNFSTGKKENLNSGISEVIVGDIRDYDDVFNATRGCDYVFHLAAQPRIQPSFTDPLSSYENNVTGTFHVLLAANECKVKRVIYAGSSSVYGDQDTVPLTEDMIPRPKSPYSQFKLMGEDLGRMFSNTYDLDVVSLRFFNVYGQRQLCEGAYATVIGIFLQQYKEGKSLTVVGDGEQRRDFTHINDIVRGLVTAMNAENIAGETINLGTGKTYSINDIVDVFGKVMVKKLPFREGDNRIVQASTQKAQDLLHWKAEENLENWLKKQISV